MKNLTDKQKRFCDQYLIDLNATQAAIRSGYSEKTANEQAARLLAKVSLQAYIAEKQKKLQQKTQITQERVLAEYAKLAFSDISDFMSWTTGAIVIKSSESLTKDQTACVSEVSEQSSPLGTTVKFKLHDKKSALDSIARHLGMFKDKLDVTADINVTDAKSKLLAKLTKIAPSEPDTSGD